MEYFENLLRWLLDHWKRWGIPTVTFVGGVVGAATWLHVRWKERADRTVDSRVFQALQNRELWHSPRGFTGAGDLLVRATELAEVLKLDCDTVTDSLKRLEKQGRVRNAGGTRSNPAPNWHILH
jgi:hypothetical protein